MKTIRIITVAGARPNFMKIAPLMKEFKKHSDIEALLVHTGQHYDNEMSKVFFDDLDIPEPDINLEVGSRSHAVQTAEIMIRFEKVVLEKNPDLVVVVGDVNSTVACALVCSKLGIKVAHVEAGLRSFDRTMPEEINRILTDAISDYLFITEKSAESNLIKEGISRDKIYFVGNVMIDTLLQHKEKSEESRVLEKLRLGSKEYAVLTLHRPSNVDSHETFKNIIMAIEEISKHIKVVFPTHPRTRRILASYSKHVAYDGRLVCIDPLGYLDFLKLMSEARIVLTDSGGMQEETTVLGIPCLTLRNNTERPVTVEQGTNVIVGTNRHRIVEEALRILNARKDERIKPDLWDGKASERIVNAILLSQN